MHTAYPTFVILSFEGPDPYSRAGGLGTRVSELSKALSSLGFETHLFFIGDPYLPGHEILDDGRLHLHRWCQWISEYHPAGVYDGEEGKLSDWNRSLPPWLESELLEPRLQEGGSVVVMAEEWQTAGSVIALHHRLLRRGLRDRVQILWNANNTFSFHRIDWGRLRRSATITTVSRYMKHVMWRLGVDARVIPNGIPDSWLQPVDRHARRELSRLFGNRLALVKVARWDPDKRWLMALDALAQLKALGQEPVLMARGGLEEHKHEVLASAERGGLQVSFAHWMGEDPQALTEALRPAVTADMVVLESYLSVAQSRLLFHGADIVLANSGLEPFGLVGLETMAAGGVAFVGCTGEDYATPGHDAISLQTSEPREIVYRAMELRRSPSEGARLRSAAKRSAMRYTWKSVIARNLIPLLEELGAPLISGAPRAEAAPPKPASVPEVAPSKVPLPAPAPTLPVARPVTQLAA
jgi:glycosyltransferase involved in cell wall biosynthesis